MTSFKKLALPFQTTRRHVSKESNKEANVRCSGNLKNKQYTVHAPTSCFITHRYKDAGDRGSTVVQIGMVAGSILAGNNGIFH